MLAERVKFANDPRMKKILMVLGLMALLPMGKLHALQGGPFDFNSPGGLRGGVYQAIMMIPNGNGMCRFSDEQGGAIALFSDSVVYYKGIVYVGNAFGVVDLDVGFVSGITNGVSDGGQNSAPRGGFGAPGAARQQPGASGRAFSSSGGNAGICNTSFTAKVDTQGASTRFYGDGEASFLGALDQPAITVNIDLDDTVGNTTTDIDRDLVSTLGENRSFNQRGERVRMKVFGSRINFTVPTPRVDTINGTQFVANPGLVAPLP